PRPTRRSPCILVTGSTSFHRFDCQMNKDRRATATTVDAAVGQKFDPCPFCHPEASPAIADRVAFLKYQIMSFVATGPMTIRAGKDATAAVMHQMRPLEI